ncbi:MAG: CHASE domain-containing protein, partial [Litorivicinus sp.]
MHTAWMVYRFREGIRLGECILAALLIAGFVLIAITVAKAQRDSTLSGMHDRVDGVVERIENDVDARAYALSQIANVFAASDFVTYQAWQTLTTSLLDQFPELTGVAYAPWLEADELDRAMAQGQLQEPSFSMFELSPRGPRPLTASGQHAPLVYLSTRDGNVNALGLDVLSEPRRSKMIQQARAEGTLIFSAPLDLVRQPGNIGILAAAPIFRSTQLQGFVISAFSVQPLVTATLTGS